MSLTYTEGNILEKQNYTQNQLPKGDYENCTFLNCDFSSSNLSGINFINCDFKYFENCLLNLSSFHKLKMKKTKFAICEMHEVDFTQTDLNLAIFDECDLMGSTFEKTNLEKADLRGAHHFSIDPELNKIKKAKVSQAGLVGFLDKYDLVIE